VPDWYLMFHSGAKVSLCVHSTLVPITPFVLIETSLRVGSHFALVAVPQHHNDTPSKLCVARNEAS